MKKILFLSLLLSLFLAQNVNAQGWNWGKSFGGASFDYAHSVATDLHGNIYVTGYFYSPTIVFGTTTLLNAGIENIFLVKCDSDGNVVWAKGFGGAGNDYGNSIAIDKAGKIYIAGYFMSPTITFGSTTLTNTSTGNTYVAKIDTDGTPLWAKSAESTDYNGANSVTTDNFGNVYITGNYRGPSITIGFTTLPNSSPGYSEIFIAKYDSSGNSVWAKCVGGSLDNTGYSVATDVVGNVFLTGTFSSAHATFGSFDLTNPSSGNNAIFLAKYNSVGVALWAKCAGSGSYDFSYSVATDASCNAYITGAFNSATLTFDTITLTKATVPAAQDMFLAKYDSLGNAIWARQAGGSLADVSNSVATDASRNVYIAGYFASASIVFGTNTLINEGDDNLFLTKYDSAGNVIWAESAGGIQGAWGFSVATYGVSKSYVVGYYSSTKIEFGLDTLTNYNTDGSLDIFLSENRNEPLSVGNFLRPTPNIYPNPAASTLTISSPHPINSIVITNPVGQLVLSSNYCNQQKVQVDVSGLPGGMYFLTLNGTEVRKFIKQ